MSDWSPWPRWWPRCTLRTKTNISTLQGILPKMLLWEHALAKNQIFLQHLAVTFPARARTAPIRHVWSLGSTAKPTSCFWWCLLFPKPCDKEQTRSTRSGVTLGRLGSNLLPSKGVDFIFKKQGLRKRQQSTWTPPPGGVGEGRLVEDPPRNKHVKSDALLKSKASDYFLALRTHLAADRQRLCSPCLPSWLHWLPHLGWFLVFRHHVDDGPEWLPGSGSLGPGREKTVKIHVCTGQNQVQRPGIV